ncbi:myb-like protein I [Biomphalaria glabrata]|uniref:Myb-like protein I n=1 Tax=Biomphalaria glabrata TaxID=6526 RepID=A0A9W3AIM1_BIOGL|nr:myb-like protein I [Biomphalaria glabrata]
MDLTEDLEALKDNLLQARIKAIAFSLNLEVDRIQKHILYALKQGRDIRDNIASIVDECENTTLELGVLSQSHATDMKSHESYKDYDSSRGHDETLDNLNSVELLNNTFGDTACSATISNNKSNVNVDVIVPNLNISENVPNLTILDNVPDLNVNDSGDNVPNLNGKCNVPHGNVNDNVPDLNVTDNVPDGNVDENLPKFNVDVTLPNLNALNNVPHFNAIQDVLTLNKNVPSEGFSNNVKKSNVDDNLLNLDISQAVLHRPTEPSNHAAPMEASGGVSKNGLSNGVPSTPNVTDNALNIHVQVQVLQHENRLLVQQIMCLQCSAAERNSLLMPCGHFILCSTCAEKCSHCPKCHVQILATSKTRL